MKILLVEDNLLNQKVVIFNLKKHNYQITAVTNGEDAMREIKNNNFKLILMDIRLPGKNGFEITHDIRNYEKENNIKIAVPIIALTANTMDNDREKCIESGMNGYLPKPFTADELVKKVNEFITA